MVRVVIAVVLLAACAPHSDVSAPGLSYDPASRIEHYNKCLQRTVLPLLHVRRNATDRERLSATTTAFLNTQDCAHREDFYAFSPSEVYRLTGVCLRPTFGAAKTEDNYVLAFAAACPGPREGSER
jgi:hypothetical protein